ncbi:PqqD family protein [Candidatus Dependentiae bacterium]|nr:PqqD family protein [Candidatus Dependentiae bacterium]
MKTKKIIINDDIISRQLNDELIILNLTNSCYYGIKKSGIEIFEFIKQKKECGIDDIIKFLSSSFEFERFSRIQIEKEISEFLSELENEKIIEIIQN